MQKPLPSTKQAQPRPEQHSLFTTLQTAGLQFYLIYFYLHMSILMEFGDTKTAKTMKLYREQR